jgi:hypothetical protein
MPSEIGMRQVFFKPDRESWRAGGFFPELFSDSRNHTSEVVECQDHLGGSSLIEIGTVHWLLRGCRGPEVEGGGSTHQSLPDPGP